MILYYYWRISQEKYKSNCIVVNKRKYKSAFVISKGEKKQNHRSYKIIKN